jgi:CRP/FNR family cyclic AMP-dependent transcriptional regulator
MRDLLTVQSPTLQSLISPDLDAALTRAAKTAQYSDGQMIHARGDAAPGLSIVRAGAVQVGNVGRDGSYLTTSVLGVGQCFGEFTLLAGLPRTHDATAVGETVVDQVPGKRFMRLYEEQVELSRALLTIALRRTHGLLEFVDDMRRLALPVRVAKFLLHHSTAAEFAVRQEEIAFTFGVSRVSMGKVLKQLELAGLIKRGYGRIKILNRALLATWVEDRLVVTPL